MNNVYEQLKPEFKKALEESGVKYSSAKRLKYVLLSKSFWGDLLIDDMKSLLTYTNCSSYEMSAQDFMYGAKFLEES
tara:strand:+ start:505 stop:735 length:231 start_codon:yes stop_codon:yes gene_type:complete